MGLVVMGFSLVSHKRHCAGRRLNAVQRSADSHLPSPTPEAPQCDVPSERVILFHTLYLPTGLLMGRRLISLNVTAS